MPKIVVGKIVNKRAQCWTGAGNRRARSGSLSGSLSGCWAWVIAIVPTVVALPGTTRDRSKAGALVALQTCRIARMVVVLCNSAGSYGAGVLSDSGRRVCVCVCVCVFFNRPVLHWESASHSPMQASRFLALLSLVPEKGIAAHSKNAKKYTANRRNSSNLSLSPSLSLCPSSNVSVTTRILKMFATKYCDKP